MPLFLTIISRDDQTTFLGFIFDRKLTFIPHLKQLNILRVLSTASWGVDRCSMLKIYHACIYSKLDYGSMVYGSARPLALKMLDPIRHKGFRLCTGAFRTSLVHTLYLKSREPPLHLCLLQLSYCSLALDHIEAEQYSNCTIYTDSLSSLLALESLHIGSTPILADIENRLAHFSLTYTSIQFFWIPGQVGIHENVLADTAAKSVCSSTITTVSIPYMDCGPVFKARLHASWQST
ncbi:uncharacterized protein LOC143251561 [Tachypleus tridentatus]|uniref:uncharacterized protein LOC143251561 n=1 Tax=Tachypleus tridentatus TaxID=6853 RepID=UPI003FD268DC